MTEGPSHVMSVEADVRSGDLHVTKRRPLTTSVDPAAAASRQQLQGADPASAHVDVIELYADHYRAAAQSYVIGSWFAARLQTVPGGTDLLILGKPTVNGVEVCSDEDSLLAEVQYW